jgi:hypothetical protein
VCSPAVDGLSTRPDSGTLVPAGQTVSTKARSGTLEDIVVADFSRVLAGPFATTMLTDLGATAIKIEAPNGEKLLHRPVSLSLSRGLAGQGAAPWPRPPHESLHAIGAARGVGLTVPGLRALFSRRPFVVARPAASTKGATADPTRQSLASP